MNSKSNIFMLGISQKLIALEKNQFTGWLEVKSNTAKRWVIYFSLGRIVWASENFHPHRSWKRHLERFCPNIEFNPKTLSKAKKFECWEYYLLTVLQEDKKISMEKLTALVESKIGEVLFDILQHEATFVLSYNPKTTSGEFLLASGLKMSLVRIEVKQALDRSHKMWSMWCEKGFERLSPNLAPILKNLEQLEQEVRPHIYQNLSESIDGQRTLRDLAVQMDRDVLVLIYSLVPYIRKGLIDFSEVPDLPISLPSTTFDEEKVYVNSKDTPQPLVACIDDSLQVLKIMEQIVRQNGYRFIGIQEPLQALPTLIVSHPDLIFLDIAMPTLNGYEIAVQLRRVSQLKETPVIMLTSQDGIVDRVRAKMVGTSGFVTKPINTSKIIEILEKILSRVDSDGSKVITLQAWIDGEPNLELVK